MSGFTAIPWGVVRGEITDRISKQFMAGRPAIFVVSFTATSRIPCGVRAVAFCGFDDDQDEEYRVASLADARLIAAAPDLLHCLKVILDHAEGREDWEVALHLDKAREAVAKAEGRA